MSLRKFNQNIRNRQNPFSDFFKDNFFDEDPFQTHFTPAANIRTLDRNYEISLAVPGYSKDDIQIKVENNVLTISAEEVKESEMTEEFTRREFYKSSFQRSFSLPEDVDEEKINAKLNDGMLTLTVGRHDRDPKVRSRKIEIKT